MKMTIGTTTIEITSCERLRDNQKGFYLGIKVPKENISSDDLEALLDGCTETIIVTEADGSETEYKGFNECASIMTKNGVRHVAQYCMSEAMAQLSLAQKKIREQTATMTTMQDTIDAQTTEIFAQAEVIVAQGETIATQNEQVAALMEASASQLDAIDSIMTEVLPLVAQEAASMAVEQAMAAIAEETPDADAQYYMEKEQEAYEEMIASETITEEN